MKKQTQTSINTRADFIWFIIAVVMMSMIGILSSDIYLPSMPYIADYFHVTYGAIQITITVYLIGLACFQLVYGPISDIYGRKPTLLLGLFIYIIASIFCTFSHSLLILMIARFFQAIGACSGLVIGRCIVSDLYDKKGTVRIFSIVLPFVAMSPAVAPVFGGYLQSFFGWRAAFACTILFGILLFTIVFYKIAETIIKKEKQLKKFNIKRVVFNNFQLIFLPNFRSYTFAASQGVQGTG